MRIDRSDSPDGPGDAAGDRRARATPDKPDADSKDSGTAVSGGRPPDSSPARPDAALRTERTVAYSAKVDAAYRQYAIDHSHARVETLERETANPAMHRIEVETREGVDDRLKVKGRLAETTHRKKGEPPQAPDGATTVTGG